MKGVLSVALEVKDHPDLEESHKHQGDDDEEHREGDKEEWGYHFEVAKQGGGDPDVLSSYRVLQLSVISGIGSGLPPWL